MKEVMQQFEVRTSQRFEEYDERMKTTRQKCKDKCDKEIQKIVLKDKIDKELTEKFATLQTDIQSDAIPTCVCEKSIADKVEKGCLKCAQNLGGIVVPSSGVLGGIAELAISVWEPAAITAAKTAALTEATKAATQAGMNAVRLEIKKLLDMFTGKPGYVDLLPIVNESTFNNGPALLQRATNLINESNRIAGTSRMTSFQTTALTSPGPYYVGDFGKIGSAAFKTEFASKSVELEAAKLGAVDTTYTSCQTAIIAPIITIVKKPKSPVDLIRVLDIHKGDYGMPTLESKNRYIPYRSGPYKGKTYIYMEGDSDSGHYYEDTTDITSSESEYEELDINDIYPYTSPKYKTLIEVVLEPSGNNTTASGNNTPSDTQNDIQNDDIPSSKITDNEWNKLKDEFISQYLQSEQPKDVPNDYSSGDIPFNTQPNTLYFDNNQEKPFISSIHDRDLYSGEEISYNINMSTNSMDDPKHVSNNVYSGIDLINDTLSGNQHIDIYDEMLKRKENELFGTNYKKNTSNNNVAKLTNSDPIMNQLDLLHKWLDRHRDMCEKWNTKEELLDKLNEQWNKDNDRGNVPIDNRSLNTDVSIQIDIDETKGKKEFSNMDTIMDDMEDDIYYDYMLK
ncbi:hypothetical protein PFFVO_05468 [Plasmodium falciparum Vietnam Oak-Knoll (FVO)]|uniref:Plasmodium falciparum erythrocyte membrane protein 1 acidic terminal segment domain-containing protein n=1 Tax=Plasmodium falciparum Vietnam Oak-Knoll (FVO) TaxID=1036723 RepID=A0A024UY72_PLAFA|nr:hypothetical protein PFFVO_05468 [Plasmodium falciparum Vietnam Oak-Knoll (FVO)]